MNLYTIGFTKKSAEEFFGLISQHNINILIDIRLGNTSQISGFTKGRDLKYFLDKICSCEYIHCPNYAPSQEIREAYRHKVISWHEYEQQYTALMIERDSVNDFIFRFAGYDNICLMCSEDTPEHCHRKLFADMIFAAKSGIRVIHI